MIIPLVGIQVNQNVMNLIEHINSEISKGYKLTEIVRDKRGWPILHLVPDIPKPPVSPPHVTDEQNFSGLDTDGER